MSAIVLVAGISCSGKTTLARTLAAETDAAYLSIDDYYRPYAELPLQERRLVDFDAPEAIEHELLVDHVQQLQRGESALKPMYDPAAFARLRGHEPVYPNPIVVIEGLFSLHWPDLRRLATLRIYVDTPIETCRQRRLQRDVTQYGRSADESAERYHRQVLPSQLRYVLPSKEHCDLVVSGDRPLGPAIAQIRGLLQIETASPVEAQPSF